MERVARGFDTEPIQRGLARIPPRILELVGPVDFLLGADPIFVGLHRQEFAEKERLNSLRHCTHITGEGGKKWWEGRQTIVIPRPLEEIYGEEGRAGAIIVHEYGHALDARTDFGSWVEPRDVGIVPISQIAELNWYEAFAEAFEAWLFPEFYPWGQELLQGSPVLALFEELAR